MSTRRQTAEAADSSWMRRAVSLARRARGRTAPNPPVGAVVVRGGRQVAAAYHTEVGGPHGEARALDRAGDGARGATLYVTLEPCAHTGRTPPCVERVLAAGVRRVVCGMRDPDPRTQGKSIARLRRGGIEVAVGVEEDACRELVRGFASRVERGRPFTELKLAATLDGRIATRRGESRWITGPKARERVHALRAKVDAIAVGIETVLADDPELCARRRGTGSVIHRPSPVVLDTRLRTPTSARLLRSGAAVIVCGRDAPASRRRALEGAGARVVPVPLRARRIALRSAWRALGRLGVNDLLVEGGGELGAALLRDRLVDRLHLVLAPVLIGGDGRPVLGSLGVDRLAQALRPRDLDMHRVGDDLWLVAEW